MNAAGEPIWAPTPDDVAVARVSGFARWLTQEGRANLTGDYLELWRWSTERLEEFWSAVCPMLPGDLIFTGTPSGVGMGRKPPEFLRPGTTLVSTIEGVGELRNALVAGPGFPHQGR